MSDPQQPQPSHELERSRAPSLANEMPHAAPEPVRASSYGYLQSSPVVRETRASFWSVGIGTTVLAATVLLRILSREPGGPLLDRELALIVAPPFAAGLAWLLYTRDFGTRRFMRAFNVVALGGLLVAFALFGRTMAGAFDDAQEVGFKEAMTERFGRAIDETLGTLKRHATAIPFASDDFTLEYPAGWHTTEVGCLQGDAAKYEALCMAGPRHHDSLIVTAMDLKTKAEARAQARAVAEEDRSAFDSPQYKVTPNITRVGSLERPTYRFEVSSRTGRDLVFVETVTAVGRRLYIILGTTPRDGVPEIRKISDSFTPQ